MIIIPAIDIIGGDCVRLLKGDFNLKTSYPGKPLEVALNYKNCGAEWIHIVDLDGARYGILKNLGIAADIKKNTGLKIEYGGGIRSVSALSEVINCGIDRAIIGTKALEDKVFFKYAIDNYKDNFILSIDFDSNGIIYKHGWQEGTELNIFNFLPDLKKSGIKEIIITNISRDGTLMGVDTSIIKRILELTEMELIIAGGVGSIDDIKKLKNIKQPGISGVIIGKAIYENKIDLKKAIKEVKL